MYNKSHKFAPNWKGIHLPSRNTDCWPSADCWSVRQHENASRWKNNNTKKYPISVSETVGRRFQSRNKQEFMAALPVGQPMCSGTRLTIISMGVRHCLRGVLLNIKVALSEDAWEITSKSCHCFAERCSPFVLRAGFVFPLHCAADDKDCECTLHHEPARCNLPLKDTNGHWA